MNKKLLGTLICTILLFTTVVSASSKINKSITEDTIERIINNFDEYPLPPPLSVDMVLEESICRRMSVRSFTGESVTDEELSTILWAAYGITENGNRSIYNPDETYSTVIYVIRSEATYKYVPENHSLSLFKSGNYLHLGQYNPPLKFGLVWDQNLESDELIGMGDIGKIGQSVYFDANALNLGTVTTAINVNDLYELGLPSNEKPEIIMSLGHPSSPYDFTYDPIPESNLPQVVNNTLSLEDAINNRLILNSWDDSPLPLLEQSQLIWSSYGYSYLIDNVNNKRHRTLPSAVAVYPFQIYAANHNGVYKYSPSSHSITEIVQGDRREAINDSLEPHNINVPTASLIIIPLRNKNQGGIYPKNLWHYENGAIINNILLESAALNLSANVIYDISNEADLRSALGISSQTHLEPLSVVPIGYPYSSPNTPPEIPDINGPTSGSAGTSYNFTFKSIDLDGDDVYYYILWGDGHVENWEGPYRSGEDFEIAHNYSRKKTYTIEAKAKDTYGDESLWGTFEITIPRSKSMSYLLFLRFLQRFPNAFPILRNLTII